MLDALLDVQVVHQRAWCCAVELQLAANSLLAAVLAFFYNVVQHLCSASPSDLVGSRSVIEEAVEKRNRKGKKNAGQCS